MKLDQICKSEHKLVDIGCNDGYITQLVAIMVASATGVEPCRTAQRIRQII